MEDSMSYFFVFIMILLSIFAVFAVFIIDPAIIPKLDFATGGCENKNITIIDKYIDDLYFVADSDENIYILCSSFLGSQRKIPIRYENYKINCTYQVIVCAFDTIMEEKRNE